MPGKIYPQKTQLLALALLYAVTANAADDRIKIDNADARVLLVTSAPGAKSELHEHKINRVMVYLDAGKMTLTDSTGVENLNFKAGEALWSPPTTRPHVSLNVSEHPVRIVEVELKSPPGMLATVKPGALDWVKVDPKKNAVEIENNQVRVVRARYAPHEPGKLHEHPWNYLVVFLTDGQLKVTSPGTEAKTTSKSAGEISFGPAGKQVEENPGDKTLEVLVVEFKK